ncbi:hypothetical protein ACFL4X_01365 [Gemmatimonadota bacterium]
MSDMATGIPIGLALGLSVGFPAGKKYTEKEIRGKIIEYAAQHFVVITDTGGAAIALEQFATDVCNTDKVQPAWLRTALIVGLSLFFILGIVVFFLVSK